MIYLRILLEAVFYLFGQIYVFQNLTVAQLAVPKAFLVFILFLPMSLPTPAGLVLSFLFGLALDIFIQPFGAHAFAPFAGSGNRYFVRSACFGRPSTKGSAFHGRHHR